MNRKSLVFLAALGAFSAAAHAQSSVLLYGIIDEGFNINTNSGGKHLYNLSAGVLQGSRWGLRGTEDLGGGLQAVFALENGFDLNTGKLGQGGLFFGRQAYVGLSSPYGSILLGRQYDAVVDNIGLLAISGQWGGAIAAHPGDLDNFNNAYRANNTVKFRSASYAGLTFEGTYSFGGVGGDVTQNQIWSMGAGYTNGPLALAAGYLNARTPAAAGGMFNTGSPTVAANAAVTTPVYSGYASANTYQVIAAAGAYTFGAATLGATYSNVRFYNIGKTFASDLVGQSATLNNAEVNFTYRLSPALVVGTAYNFTRSDSINGASGADYHQGASGVDYFLSKRTDVYAVAVYQHASGMGSNGRAAVAAINTLTPSSNSNQFVARFGIRHKF